jgi:hypothetical protein
MSLSQSIVGNVAISKSEAAMKAIGNSWSKYIKDTFTLYAKVGDRLHTAAAYALHQAATFGQTGPMNDLFKGLRENDRTALRMWIGAHATYVQVSDDPEKDDKIVAFVRYMKDDGFKMLKGADRHIVKADFTLENTLNLPSFLDEKIQKEGKAISLEDLLKLAAGFKKNFEKRAESKEVDVPNDLGVIAALAALEAVATRDLENMQAAQAQRARMN